MTTTIRAATASDATTVATMVHKLLSELRGKDREPPQLSGLIRTAEQFVGGDLGVWAFLAENDLGQASGVITLNECAAIYAGGRFGVISELYIEPAVRSGGAGRQLLDAAAQFGLSRHWTSLEVGAPHLPRWARTVAFYQDNEFVQIGPRLKRVLTS